MLYIYLHIQVSSYIYNVTILFTKVQTMTILRKNKIYLQVTGTSDVDDDKKLSGEM
jgi:hypothetical protein